MFDFYRIRGVKLTFIPRQTSETEWNVDRGRFYWAVDYDDVVGPNTTTFLQKQGLRVKYAVTKPWSIFIRPVASMLVYNGALSTSAYAQARRRMWLDMANASVPYYGLKYVWTHVTDAPVTLDVHCKFYVECKGVQ